jgi:hypothetical protein
VKHERELYLLVQAYQAGLASTPLQKVEEEALK